MSECLNAKIVIVGDGAIGKTCVMVRYILIDAVILKVTTMQNIPLPYSKTKPSISISTIE